MRFASIYWLFAVLIIVGTFLIASLTIKSSNSEKEIVVIIPSYNNGQWHRYNLGSVFVNFNNYRNCRVVYIDDCSSDGTYEVVSEYVKKHGYERRVEVKKNTERKGALYNLYHAIHACADHVIIAMLDGDDWFKHDLVLSKINHIYDDSNVWMTYGSYEIYPGGKLGICRALPESVIQNKTYRSHYPWETSHLRTFRAGLFKRVKYEDLLYNGSFFAVTWDQAFMYPMMEMAGKHVKFVEEVLYVYNQVNPLNDFRVRLREQLYCERLIRGKKPYERLSEEEGRLVCGITA